MATVRRYRGRYVADFRDQHGRRRIERPRGPFETKALEKRAAQDLLSERLKEVASKRYRSVTEKPTFSRLADLFLANKVRARKTTLEGYRELIDCYLRPYFATRRADEITSFDIEQFRDELAAAVPHPILQARKQRERELQMTNPGARLRPLRPGARTINKCLILMVGIMGYAARHRFATGNSAEGIEKLKEREGESRVIEENVLTPAEIRLVIDAAVDTWRLPIMFAAVTGVRKAEIAGLQWPDIDWNRRSAEIRRTWRRGDFYEPKTKASRRTVELSDELISELKRWKLRCPKGEHDLVFPTSAGGPMDATDVLRLGLYPALRRAGIRQVRFHDLRHSFASNLLAAGVDAVTVSRALGHASPHITMTIYAHALPNARRGTAEKMAQLMEESGNKMETATPKSDQAA